MPDDDLLAVDTALDLLAAKDRVKVDLVKLRFYAGFTADRAAESLGLSSALPTDIGPLPALG